MRRALALFFVLLPGIALAQYGPGAPGGSAGGAASNVAVSNFPTTQPVQGTVGVGLPPALPPVSISGVDGAGNKQHLLLDTSGKAQVVVTAMPTLPAGANAIGSVSVSNLPATQPVSGTTVPTGTAGTPNAGVVSVQGIAGGTAQPVSGTVGVSSLPSIPAGTNAIGGVTTQPTAIIGFGKLAATNASALVSTMTLGPNSGAWPATPGMVYVTNASTSGGLAYFCPLGGTCSAANGIPLVLGQSYGFSGPATAMTVIAATTASVSVQF